MIGTSHDQPHRTHACRWLSALALGLFSLNAQAGYANAVPPSGWSAGTGAGATYRAAANETWLSSTVRTNAALNVGGKAVQVPATMRLAANAPRFAARFLFVNPAVAVGAVVLSTWLANKSLFWDAEQKRWIKQLPGIDTTIDQNQYSISGYPEESNWKPTKAAACTHSAQLRFGWLGVTGVVSEDGTYCQYNSADGSYYNSTGFMYRTKPVTFPGDPIRVPIGDTEFENIMAPEALPEGAPNALPTPLPVEQPKLNPIPSPSGQPSPLRVPNGDPYPVPNTDPQRYERPVTDIVPSPTLTEPWRVDLQPRVIETPSLDPNVLPTPNPSTDPAPKNDEQPDLCEKNPDILACQKPELDTPEQDIPRKDFAVTFAAETLFGTGSCPADRTMNFRGQTLTVWDFAKTCDYLTTYLKPVLILLATFSAFMIISPGKEA